MARYRALLQQLGAGKHLQALLGNTFLTVMVCAGLALLLGAVSVGAARYITQTAQPTVAAEQPPTATPEAPSASGNTKPTHAPAAEAPAAQPPVAIESAEAPDAHRAAVPREPVAQVRQQAKTSLPILHTAPGQTKKLLEIYADEQSLQAQADIPLAIPGISLKDATISIDTAHHLRISIKAE